MLRKLAFLGILLLYCAVARAACGPGYWQNGGTCVKCPDGYTSTGQITAQDDCYMEIAPGYYWTGSGVAICPQNNMVCAGGNMPYSSRGAAWGIVECEEIHSWVYYGATSCTVCPVEPLNGRTGTMTAGGCFLRMYSTDVDIRVNEYTTANANCYWNGTHYAAGGNNTYSCDSYNITACAAGYYAPEQSKFGRIECHPVGVGYYSAAAELGRAQCPAGTSTHGDDAASADECLPLCDGGLTRIRAGEYGFSIWKNKPTSPAVHIRAPNGDICYAALAPGRVDGGVNIRYNNAIYHVTN